MVPEELKKWISVFERVTSTTAVILLVIYLVWQNTGDRNQVIFAAKAGAEEAVMVSRANKEMLEGHIKMSSEDSSVTRMILIQICINTAQGDRQIITQCANYR